MSLRKCRVCSLEAFDTYQLELFQKSPSAKYGYENFCKSCASKKARISREKNHLYYTNSLSRLNKHIEFLKDCKNIPCQDCGKEYPHYVMDFDHVKSKSFPLSQGAATRSLESLKEEVAKCEVVCANCHRIRTFQRRNRHV